LDPGLAGSGRADVDGGTNERAIDLHVHTTRSDGDYSPEEVVGKARDLGLSAIAITDHDSLEGVEEGLQAGARRGVEVVPGVELSVKYGDLTQVHLLAYYLDWCSESMNQGLTELRDARVGRGQRLVEKINVALQGEGREPLRFEDVARHSEGLIARPHIAKELLERGYCRDMADAFQRYLIPLNIAKHKPSFEEAVRSVKKAGGVPVLAHPNLIQPGWRLDADTLDALIDLGLEGMEVYYHSLSDEDSAYYRNLAARRDLIITGGSDFHGEASYGNLGLVGKGERVPYSCLAGLKARFLRARRNLVIMSGLPGSGKSTLAQRIAKLLDARIVSSDALRREHFPPGSALREFRYSAEVSSAVYRILRLEAEVTLLQGRSVVIDATFLLRHGRTEFLEVARKTGAGVLFVSCRADEETSARRTRTRPPADNHASEADFEVYNRMKSDLEGNPERWVRVEEDPQVRGFPVMEWDSSPGIEGFTALIAPDNLTYLTRFSLA
jgi:3',5'-nucleoside bisphosphate phosphatase